MHCESKLKVDGFQFVTIACGETDAACSIHVFPRGYGVLLPREAQWSSFIVKSMSNRESVVVGYNKREQLIGWDSSAFLSGFSFEHRRKT